MLVTTSLWHTIQSYAIFIVVMSFCGNTAIATLPHEHILQIMNDRPQLSSGDDEPDQVNVLMESTINEAQKITEDDSGDDHSSEERDEDVRYFEMPEGIASLTIQPTLKKRISIARTADFFIGIGCPIEIAVAHPALQHPELFGQSGNAFRDRVHRKSRSVIPTSIIQRLHIYRSIEETLSMSSVPIGRVCIQRAICESTKFRFAEDDQLIAEILTVVLRIPNNDIPAMQPYNEAQRFGRKYGNCSAYDACPISLYKRLADLSDMR